MNVLKERKLNKNCEIDKGRMESVSLTVFLLTALTFNEMDVVVKTVPSVIDDFAFLNWRSFYADENTQQSEKIEWNCHTWFYLGIRDFGRIRNLHKNECRRKTIIHSWRTLTIRLHVESEKRSKNILL